MVVLICNLLIPRRVWASQDSTLLLVFSAHHSGVSPSAWPLHTNSYPTIRFCPVLWGCSFTASVSSLVVSVCSWSPHCTCPRKTLSFPSAWLRSAVPAPGTSGGIILGAQWRNCWSSWWCPFALIECCAVHRPPSLASPQSASIRSDLQKLTFQGQR